MSTRNLVQETFVIERTYDASVAQVFQAWSDPMLKARWFAGSVDALNGEYKLDFRVGGLEVNQGGPPGGPVYRYQSQFRDIVIEERIVYTYEMHADENRISVSLATVEFFREANATRLVVSEYGVFLDGRDTAAKRKQGTEALLDSLEALFAKDPS